MQGNISENYEFMKQKLRIATYGIHESSYELAKLRISKATNFEVYLYIFSLLWFVFGNIFSLVSFMFSEWHIWQPQWPRAIKSGLRGLGCHGYEASGILSAPSFSPNQIWHDVLPSRHFILHSGRVLNFQVIKSSKNCILYAVMH